MVGGRVYDKYIVESSGYLNYILPGDIILRFDVADSIAMYWATLDIPACAHPKVWPATCKRYWSYS